MDATAVPHKLQDGLLAGTQGLFQMSQETFTSADDLLASWLTCFLQTDRF